MSERVRVSCYRILAVKSFVLKVWSWSGNNVHIYLFQMNVFFVFFFFIILALSREGRVSRQNFTLKCPILDKQKQISFGSSLGARFPHSAQLSSLMEPGIQPNRSCLLRLSKCGDQFQRLRPRKMVTASRLQRQGWGRGSPLLKAWAKATVGP